MSRENDPTDPTAEDLGPWQARCRWEREARRRAVQTLALALASLLVCGLADASAGALALGGAIGVAAGLSGHGYAKHARSRPPWPGDPAGGSP